MKVQPEKPMLIDETLKLGEMKRRCSNFFCTAFLAGERRRVYRGGLILTGTQRCTARLGHSALLKRVVVYLFDVGNDDTFHVGDFETIKSVRQAKQLIDSILESGKCWYGMGPGDKELPCEQEKEASS